MSIPTQYDTIAYIDSDDGSFESNFNTLFEENLQIKRTWKESSTDEDGLYNEQTKYKVFDNNEVQGVITQPRVSKGIDESKKVTTAGNYIIGEKILLTTAILYFDNNDDVNDIVVIDDVEYNIIGSTIVNKLIPHVVYSLKVKVKKVETTDL